MPSQLIDSPKKIICGLILLLVLLRLPAFFDDFMDSDEGIYGTVGLSIKHGDLPYRDAIERKTPLIYYTYAAVFSLFGDGNMLALHFFLTLWIGLTGWVLFLITRELLKEWREPHPGIEWAPYGTLFAYFVFTTYYNFEWLAANCEMFLDLPLAIGFWLIAKNFKKSHPWPALLSGIFFGVAFLFKQTALMPLAATGAFLVLGVLAIPQQRIWRLLSWSIGMACGFAAIVALSYLYFYSRGIQHDYYYWSWLVNFKYVHDSFDKSYVIKKFLIHSSFFLLSLLPMWVGISRIFPNLRRSTFSMLMLVAWLLGQGAALWISGKFYTHYYFLLMAPLSVLFGLGLSLMSQIGRKRLINVSLGLALLYCVAWFFREDLHRAYGYGAPDYRSIAAYIESKTPADERIFVWGYSPEIYVLSKRLPASRFIFCDYLTGRISGHPRVKDPTFDTLPFATPGAWEMLQEDLESKKPLYIIDTTPGNFHQYGKYPMHRYPWLKTFVSKHYSQETQVAEATLYRRLDVQ